MEQNSFTESSEEFNDGHDDPMSAGVASQVPVEGTRSSYWDMTDPMVQYAVESFHNPLTEWYEWPEVDKDFEPSDIVQEVYDIWGDMLTRQGPTALPVLFRLEEYLAAQLTAARNELVAMSREARDGVYGDMLSWLVPQFLIRLRTLRRLLRSYVIHGKVHKPTREEIQQKKGGVAHDRTMTIGRALLHHMDTSGGMLPDFDGQVNNFLDWAADVIEWSRSTARNALNDTGCYVTGTQGAPGALLDQTIRKTVEYAQKYSGSQLS